MIKNIPKGFPHSLSVLIYIIVTSIGVRAFAFEQCRLSPSDGQAVIRGKVLFPKGIKMSEHYSVSVLMLPASTNQKETTYPIESRGNFWFLFRWNIFELLEQRFDQAIFREPVTANHFQIILGAHRLERAGKLRR